MEAGPNPARDFRDVSPSSHSMPLASPPPAHRPSTALAHSEMSHAAPPRAASFSSELPRAAPRAARESASIPSAHASDEDTPRLGRAQTSTSAPVRAVRSIRHVSSDVATGRRRRSLHSKTEPSPVHRTGRRHVLLHADDFGMNREINAGVMEGLASGWLTSTSLLANAPYREEALRLWRCRPQRDASTLGHPNASLQQLVEPERTPPDLGIHLNLTQGRPLTGDAYPAALLDSQGYFPGVFALFRATLFSANRYKAALRAELQAQIEWMCDHGCTPSHVNGHQYIELLPCLADLLPPLLARYEIPRLRWAGESGLWRSTLAHGNLGAWLLGRVKRHFADRAFVSWRAKQLVPSGYMYCGTTHAGRITLDTVRQYLKATRRATTVEIGLHPAAVPEDESEVLRQVTVASGTPAATGTTFSPEADGEDRSPLASAFTPRETSAVRAARGDAPCDSERRAWSDPLASLRPRELRLVTSPELAALLAQENCVLARHSRTLGYRATG